MGFKRSYQINNLSNQLNIRKLSTVNTQLKINPYFVTEFSDAESCFHFSIYKSEASKIG
jgi:hypothetical protein